MEEINMEELINSGEEFIIWEEWEPLSSFYPKEWLEKTKPYKIIFNKEIKKHGKQKNTNN